ncbi:MAG: hypothetical protein V1874_10075 [Spirochaetota bacterium]
MNKKIFASLFITVLLGAVFSAQVYSESMKHKTGKQIVFYVAPMGLKDWSPKAKKDSMGMDYLPVYLEEWGTNDAKVVEFYYLKVNSDKKSATLIAVYDSRKKLKHGQKIGFYGNPMGPEDFSSKMKKDSMGMNYVPVYID